MDLPRDVKDYIKETIDHSLGIPISMDALQKKLYAAQESQLRLREQCLSLVSRLREKDQVIDLVRSEASINAQALKKFVEENQELRGENADLVNQCKDLKRKCFINHLDLEASMRSVRVAEEKARKAEERAKKADQELRHVYNVIKRHESLVDSVLAPIVSQGETKFGRTLLEANIDNQACEDLLSRWDQLKPSMQKAVTLISMVMELDYEKECLILKLDRAEQEVEVVREQNRELDKEFRMLLKKCRSYVCSERTSRFKKNKEKEA